REWIGFPVCFLASSKSTPAHACLFHCLIRCKATAPVANSFRQAKRLPCNSFEVGEQRGLRLLIGQRFGALLAGFHDELVECWVDGEWIVAIETSKAKTVQRFSRRANHPFHIKV